MYTTALFDLDGTLLDTTEGVIESVKYAAKKLGCSELPYETLLQFVGPPIQASFIKYYNFSVADAQQAANIFRNYYKEQAMFKAIPYDGIYELCSALRSHNIKLAVATYKREDYAIQLLKHFGFDKYFDVMHGADNNNVLTKSDIIMLCVSELDSKPSECVLIGDSIYDAKGAQEAGIDFLGVTYGFGFKHREDIGYLPNVGMCRSVQSILSFLNIK